MKSKKTRKHNIKKKSLHNMTRREAIKTAIAGAATIPFASLNDVKAEVAQEANDVQAANWREYSLAIQLDVPRVYSNTSSQGYRKYQRQLISGKLMLGFDENGTIVDVQFKDMINKTHKLSSGANVTYDAKLSYTAGLPRFNAIGSNKTAVFKTATICFSIVAEPSYNIGELDEDTSLYITLAGKGTIDQLGRIKMAKGQVAGTLGCGCQAYGHMSPTRTIGYDGATSTVTDVAAVFGNWSMKIA